MFELNDACAQVVQVCPERGAVEVLNPKGQDKLFTYDAVYDASADTQTIYDEMVGADVDYLGQSYKFRFGSDSSYS